MLNRRVTTACVTLLAVVLTSAGCGGDDTKSSAADQNEKAELEIWTRRTPGSEQEKTTQRLAEAFTKKTGIPTKVVAIFEGFETKLQQRAAAEGPAGHRHQRHRAAGHHARAGPRPRGEEGRRRGRGRHRRPRVGRGQGHRRQVLRGADLGAVLRVLHPLGLAEEGRRRPSRSRGTTWSPSARRSPTRTRTATARRTRPASSSRRPPSAATPPGTGRPTLYQAGGDYFEREGRQVHAAPSRATRRSTAAKCFQDQFCKSKVVVPGAVTANTNTSHQLWEAGKAGIYLTGPYVMARFDKSLGKDKFEVIKPPAGPGGKGSAGRGRERLPDGRLQERVRAGEVRRVHRVGGGPEIGMDGDNAGPIVRLPVNTKVDMANDAQGHPLGGVPEALRRGRRLLAGRARTGRRSGRCPPTRSTRSSADCSADPKKALDKLGHEVRRRAGEAGGQGLMTADRPARGDHRSDRRHGSDHREPPGPVRCRHPAPAYLAGRAALARRRRRQLVPWLFLAPALILFALFKFVPMVRMVRDELPQGPAVPRRPLGRRRQLRPGRHRRGRSSTRSGTPSCWRSADRRLDRPRPGARPATGRAGRSLWFVRTAVFLPVVAAMAVVAEVWRILYYPAEDGAINIDPRLGRASASQFLNPSADRRCNSVMAVGIWRARRTT